MENEIQEDHYRDLLAFNFKSKTLKSYIKSIIKKHFDWYEFEMYRSIQLLKKIKSGQMELVFASRKLRELYLEQEDEINEPLLSIEIAVGYESVLDNCPIEPEYKLWNPEALKKQLELVEMYRERMLKDVEIELKALQTQSSDN